jgi:hypothetical protein
MRKVTKKLPLLVALIAAFIIPAAAQREGRTTYTGTAIIYGTGASTRVINRTFRLDLYGETSDAEQQTILNTLRNDGQDRLLRDINDRELGRFSLGGGLGLPVNAVMVEAADGGRQRIRVIFARWIGFGELRTSARSSDYPFSYIELLIDPRTGRGTGEYFQAAKLRSRGGNTLEIEDFGTFPSRLLGVSRRGRVS